MKLPPLRMSAPLAAVVRLSLVAVLFALPILAMPATGGEDAILVGRDLKTSSGAGLVIVAGLQRAR